MINQTNEQTIIDFTAKHEKYLNYMQDIFNNYKEFKHLQHNYTEFNVFFSGLELMISSLEFDLNNKTCFIEDTNTLFAAIDRKSKKSVITMIKEAAKAGK